MRLTAGFCQWLGKPQTQLYVSNFLSSWGTRMWGFAVGLYLILLWPNSLLLTAAYGLVKCLSIVALGAPIGQIIDKTTRIRAAQFSVVFQNVSVIGSAVILAIFLQYQRNNSDIPDWVTITTYVVVIALAVLADLGTVASKISIEKDWIVVIAQNDSKQLAVLNSTLKTIDLVTYILSPVLVGQLMTYVSPVVAAIVIGCWNVLSMPIECHLLGRIFRLYPELANKNRGSSDSESVHEEEKEEPRGKVGIIASWKIFFDHPVHLAGMGLSMLYMTVLGFDSVTTGYAYSQGVSESVVSLLTAVSAVMGIVGSLTFPVLRNKIGVERTGLFGFAAETAALTLCIGSVWAPGSPFDPTYLWTKYDTNANNVAQAATVITSTVTTELPTTAHQPLYDYTSIFLLMAGIVISRFGLWLADLSVAQVLQERVEEQRRGVIAGVQQSLCMSMNLLKFLLVVLLPDWQTFGYLIILSVAAVASGWLCFALYSRKQRGHLFHFHRIIDTVWSAKSA